MFETEGNSCVSWEELDWLGTYLGLAWACSCRWIQAGTRASPSVVFLPGLLCGKAVLEKCSKRAKVEVSGPLEAWTVQFAPRQSCHILLAQASHKASPDAGEWRNRPHLWMRRMAKSHGRGACVKYAWPLNNVYCIVWKVLVLCRPRLLLIQSCIYAVEALCSTWFSCEHCHLTEQSSWGQLGDPFLSWFAVRGLDQK